MQNENGVLEVQEDFGNALVDKYAPVWDKKYRSKGESIWVFQRRTLSSACQVATTLHDMDFGKASTFLFHLVREAEECKPIIEAVSSQVELAMANPDKFIKGYHQFLQGLTKPIKKNKDYALYFKAIAYAQECVHSGLSIDGVMERNDSVLYAVIDMLMQGSEYLKPQEFDIVNNIVGISTENEPIIIRDPYPLADVPVYYSEALFNNRPYDKCDFQISEDRRLDMVFSYYKRYGYENVADFDSINNLALLSHLYTNTVLSMATYVNEYTVDMLPDEPLRVFDKSKYDASSKNINGFIRHLPAGQKASERAILIAESYGYELKSDETYVTPFVRRQWLKKKTEESITHD